MLLSFKSLASAIPARRPGGDKLHLRTDFGVLQRSRTRPSAGSNWRVVFAPCRQFSPKEGIRSRITSLSAHGDDGCRGSAGGHVSVAHVDVDAHGVRPADQTKSARAGGAHRGSVDVRVPAVHEYAGVRVAR